jgi:D-proline reductase (dithiol) PrdB
MGDEQIRAAAADRPVPEFDGTPFVQPPPLAHARVAIVTTAALRRPDQPAFEWGDQSYRVLGAKDDELTLGHGSPNFDRSGWLADRNVVLPVDRLDEMAADGLIGSVAPRHLAFAGNQDETMTTIRLDSGPAAARELREDGVDVVLITGL